jgi:hypothetical protein
MAGPLDNLRPPARQPMSSQRGARGQIDPRIQQAVTTVAGQYNVDPTLAIALLRQENSAQNPNAVGSSGEVGLFQILPTTALTYAQVPGNTPQERIANMTEQLKNPYFNTQIAMQHLKRLGDMFQNDPEKVFAAYNAGPTTVVRAERDAQARGIPWQQSIQENRATRGVRPGQVQDYVTSATGLLQEGGGVGAPVSSTGVQRDILRAVPPEAPTIGLAPGIPVPVGAPPPTPPPVPLPPVRPQPPAGPPTPPERTPVTPPKPPISYGSLPGDYIAQERGGAPPPGVPPERTPVTPPLGLAAAKPAVPILDTDMMSGAPMPGPSGPPPSVPPPAGNIPVFDRDILSGAPMPGPPTGGGATSTWEPRPENAPILDRDMLSGMPMTGPPSRGVTGTWEPSLANVPQDVRTPGAPPVAPQADVNTALGSLTDEELADLYQWLQEQGTAPPAPVMPPGGRPYYHMGGMPAIMPSRMPFADQSRWVWEGGR